MNFIPENASTTRKSIGGKAYNLQKLCNIGVNVPEYIVLASDLFFEFLGDNLKYYHNLLENYCEANRLSIINLIENCSFSHKTKDDIAKRISEVFGNNALLSVRSSAVDEDGKKHSFAGMLESKLKVCGIDNVLESVKKCYISCFSERAMEYRAANNLICPEISVAVIIQKMINAQFSGVIFTTNPSTNNPDEMLISVVEGLGEKLVSGECNSSDYIADCTGSIVSGNEDTAVVPDKILQDLFNEAIKIENGFEARIAQDIEFCISDNIIYILQCRPITNYSHIDKNKFRTILDNSNIIESYTGVTTPLTFTFAREVYSKIYKQTLRSFYVSEASIKSIEDDLDNMLEFYENKVYYRLNSWYKMTALYPGYKKNKQYMENMMGVKTALHESQSGAKTRLIRIYASFIRKLLRMKKDSALFIEKFNRVTLPYKNNTFDNFSNDDVLDVYSTLEKEILDDFITPIANDMGAMVFYGILTNQVKEKCPDKYEGLISSVIRCQGNVESAQQSLSLLKIAEKIKLSKELRELFDSDNTTISKQLCRHEAVASMIDDYICNYGARTMDELKLETITLSEDPSFLYDTLRGYLKCDKLPDGKQKEDSNAESELLSHFFVLKRPFIRILLKITKYFIRNRESLRLRRTYIYDIIRNIYLRIGKNFQTIGLIDNFRDIFFLTRPEISQIVENRYEQTGNLRSLIEKRKAEYNVNKTKTVYERMYFYGDVSPENMLPIYSRQEVKSDDVLCGVAGGGEIVTGIVRLVEDPAQADVEGYILMAKRTDPGWTVLFPMAKAIIIERGSVLSHSAVVAREMGITLVAGIRGLTSSVKDGMRVRVDGVKGTVEILGNENDE